MNALNRQRINQYRNIKMYIAACFWIFSLSVLANGSKTSSNENKVEDDAVKIDIIINKNNMNDFENENDSMQDENSEEGDLIFLDQIRDEEEEEKKKKQEKINKLERFIRKIDEKVNPIIRFQISKSYGRWYLIKSNDISETMLENIRYDFIQEENGYQIVKSYFDPKTDTWQEDKRRGWIEEKKGHVYLDIEKKYFKNNRSEILFFDKNYHYMIIRFSDGFIRVLSRYPNNEEISLENEELAEFINFVSNINNMRDIHYNTNIKSIREMESDRKKDKLRKKTEYLERKLSEDPTSVFQIDTIGAKRYHERQLRKQKVPTLEKNNSTKSVEVIELNNKDLKNETEIKSNSNNIEINKEY
ncbi:hypothetical protein AB8B23_07800 [Leptotrichia sp. HSP-342]|uniref:Uncharacterized protein n=1 Tax=Leptotrichia mesophila TaxID=3239303 RepID=A0AB39V965_9FUSO